MDPKEKAGNQMPGMNECMIYWKVRADGDYKRMAELLHLWRWSGITREELLELQAGLQDCLEEINKQI